MFWFTDPDSLGSVFERIGEIQRVDKSKKEAFVQTEKKNGHTTTFMYEYVPLSKLYRDQNECWWVCYETYCDSESPIKKMCPDREEEMIRAWATDGDSLQELPELPAPPSKNPVDSSEEEAAVDLMSSWSKPDVGDTTPPEPEVAEVEVRLMYPIYVDSTKGLSNQLVEFVRKLNPMPTSAKVRTITNHGRVGGFDYDVEGSKHVNAITSLTNNVKELEDG